MTWVMDAGCAPVTTDSRHDQVSPARLPTMINSHPAAASSDAPARAPIGPGGSRLPRPVQILASVGVLLIAIFIPQLMTLIPGVRQLLSGAPNTAVVFVSAVLIQLLPTVIALLLLRALLHLDGRRTLSMIGWRLQRRAPATLLAGIGVSLVAMVLPAIALSAGGLLRPVDPAALARWEQSPWWMIVISLVLTGFAVQAIPEELIFRGYLLRSLRTGRTAAILISSATFGVLHLISGGGQQDALERVLYLAMPLGFGFAAAVLSLRWDSLWAAIGVHGGLHIAYPIVYVLGLGDGPWLWCIAGLIWTLIGLLALLVPVRT
jgi:membrane protease YdiL (CAAX protease family)